MIARRIEYIQHDLDTLEIFRRTGGDIRRKEILRLDLERVCMAIRFCEIYVQIYERGASFHWDIGRELANT